MTEIKNRLIPVGCDDGHFAIKICAGKDKYFTVPSRISSGRNSVSDEQGNVNSDLHFKVSEDEFLTITAYSRLATDDIDTRDDDFALSSANRALVYHSLSRAVEQGVISGQSEISMVSGLPVDRFYNHEGRPDNDFINRKSKSFMTPMGNRGDSYIPTVAKHMVISEAVASYFDALYDFDGNEDEDFKIDSDSSPIAVVDIGGKTLDVAIVAEGGNGLYFTKSGTSDAGVLYFYKSLNETLIKHFQGLYPEIHFKPFSVAQIDGAVNTGFIHVYGRKDVSEFVNKELDEFAGRVRNFISPKVGDGAEFGRILFVGGGANLLHDRLHMVFPNIPLEAITSYPPTDDLNHSSTFSNARGMYKAALFLA